MGEPFHVQFERVNQRDPQLQRTLESHQAGDSPSFAKVLSQTQQVRFSNHAQQRLEKRHLQLSEENVSRLAEAIDKAEKRGGKSSLVLVDDLAFIVNVRDRLVVTALDASQRGEGVFTQIDSVVFADPLQSRSGVDLKG